MRTEKEIREEIERTEDEIRIQESKISVLETAWDRLHEELTRRINSFGK